MNSIERWAEELSVVTEFTVTDRHLALLRAAYVQWGNGRFGAPSIDPKRPYGSSVVTESIAKILNTPRNEDDEGAEALELLHVETMVALQIVLDTGSFQPGLYRRDSPDEKGWRLIEAQPEDWRSG